MQKNDIKPKHRDKIEALDNLSLGISMVVAVAIGVGVGLLLKKWTGYSYTLWIGVFWGVSAAILNVYKAYKRAKDSYKELENDPRYQYRINKGIKEEDD
jgi:F0F1-type ATP synthase assembly protein I